MKPTQEQVIAWAREADGELDHNAVWLFFELELFHFATLAYEAGRKDENEACAKVCDKLGDEYADANPADCAFAIRTRREQ